MGSAVDGRPGTEVAGLVSDVPFGTWGGDIRVFREDKGSGVGRDGGELSEVIWEWDRSRHKS